MTDLQAAALASIATIPILYALDNLIAVIRYRRRHTMSPPSAGLPATSRVGRGAAGSCGVSVSRCGGASGVLPVTRGPVNKCAVRACPVIGRWDEGERCPMHRDTEPPRRPSLAEQWEVDE